MDSKYKPTIGLEIHAELRTATKMFCSCKNDPDEVLPNVNVCPVCMAHPGALPVINKEAVKSVLKVGLAVRGKLAGLTEFDRKNYFYPDIPKGYQISQYKNPLVLGGFLKDIKITRVHLEEDTARSQHVGGSDVKSERPASLVDFNRAGVPLMELVTEPDITSAKQAKDFVEELQLTLQYLGASEANMEKVEMRCEANISVYRNDAASPKAEVFQDFSQRDGARLSNSSAGEYAGLEKSAAEVKESASSNRLSGTKVEVKNLNSFRTVEKAIEFEIKRQIELLEKGEKVKQETRGWDENKQVTFSQRSKESAHDYRYFQEPDLPPMEFNEAYFEELNKTIPELPAQKRARLIDEYKLEPVAVDILIRDKALSAFWEKMGSELREWLSGKTPGVESPKTPGVEEECYKLAANYFTSDLLGLIKAKQIPASELLVEPENFAELIKMIYKQEITTRVAKDVLRHMVEVGGDPSTIVEEKGLKQVSDTTALEEIAKKIISTNPNAIADYKKGKQKSLKFLVGQMMKETKGAVNPETIREILTKFL